MGVVYYANYLVWFEVGAHRSAAREPAGATGRWRRRGIALPVIEAHCEYRPSARYDDDLEVRTSGRCCRRSACGSTTSVVRAADEATLADGHTVHASLDAVGRPRRLPDRVRAVLGV